MNQLYKTIESDADIRSVHFFNGRLLSAEDLSQEQNANRDPRLRLGQALGDGIAYGLEVRETPGSPPLAAQVTITRGLAVNRGGQTLQLHNDTDVFLVRPLDATTPQTSGFEECDPLKPGVYVAGAGLYLLTIAPASHPEGLAPVSGLGNLAAACNKRFDVESVQFKLLSLNSLLDALDDGALMRNHVAYLCFGSNEELQFYSNPFGERFAQYGLLDVLRDDCLADGDVPLAIVHWTQQGIQFIDMWAVRRRIIRHSADDQWNLLTADRRAAEAEAMFYQFQEQLADIRASETGLGSIEAASRFRFLPPVGMLPVRANGAAGDFDPLSFFAEHRSSDIELIDASQVRGLMNEGLDCAPIDLQTAGRIQLYRIWENVQAIQAGQTNQLAVIFAHPRLPYRGIARFGYARANIARYTPRVV